MERPSEKEVAFFVSSALKAHAEASQRQREENPHLLLPAQRGMTPHRSRLFFHALSRAFQSILALECFGSRIAERGSGAERSAFPRRQTSRAQLSEGALSKNPDPDPDLVSSLPLSQVADRKMPPRPPLPKQQQLQKQQHSAANAKGAHARVSASKLKKRATAVAPRPAVLPPMTTTKTTSSPPSPPPPSSTSSKALPRLLPAPLAARLEGAHKPAGLVLASSLLMQASVDVYETGIFTAGAAEAAVSSSSTSTAAAAAAAAAVFFSSSSAHPLITGTAALAGAALGLLYACILYPLAERTAWALPSRPLSVVVTGGSRGLGKALAREHLLAGDSVVVAARDFGRLLSAAKELAEETGADMVLAGGEEEGGGREEKEEEKEESSSPFPSPPRPPIRRPTITPVACDVSNADSVNRLVSASLEVLEGARIDCFYNNAGDSGSFRSFADSDPETLSRVVSTNLLGSVLCTRAVVEAMTREREGSSLGHIFLVEVSSFSLFFRFPSFSGNTSLCSFSLISLSPPLISLFFLFSSSSFSGSRL